MNNPTDEAKQAAEVTPQSIRATAKTCAEQIVHLLGIGHANDIWPDIETALTSVRNDTLISVDTKLEEAEKERDDWATRARSNFKDAQSAFGALGYGQKNDRNYENYIADQLRDSLAKVTAEQDSVIKQNDTNWAGLIADFARDAQIQVEPTDLIGTVLRLLSDKALSADLLRADLAKVVADSKRLDWLLSTNKCASTIATPDGFRTERYTTREQVDVAMNSVREGQP